MDKVKKLNLILAVCGLTLSILCAILLKYRTFSKYHPLVAKNAALTVGGNARKSWDEQAYNYELQANIFGAENPDGIQQGEKPKLIEYGPFIFDLEKRRIDVLEHDEDDTLSYIMKRNYVYNFDKSNPFRSDVPYEIPNYFLLLIANAALKARPALLPLVSRSVDAIFKKPPNLFINNTIQQHLFDGIPIYCTGIEEFFVKIVCNLFKEGLHDFHMTQIPGEETYVASPWKWLNDTLEWAYRIRIKRGIENLADVAKFVQYNNSNNFSIWEDDKCDAFHGTDGTAFSPYLTKNDVLHVVNTPYSRTFAFYYDSDVKHYNLKTYRFTGTVGTDLDTNPDDKCYCMGECIKNGVYEVFKCLNWALVFSNAHFYGADPYYASRLVGIQPIKDKHLSFIDVDPLTGIVIKSSLRIQYNALLKRQPKFRLMKNISDSFFPFLWSEEIFTLSEPAVKKVAKIHTMIRMEKIVLFMLMLVGLILFGLGLANSIRELKKK